jgi:Helix-turn-helix domain of transposase family ISL3
VCAQLRRLDCPEHGVVVEAVPFARHKSRFARDVEDLVAWCATKMDQTAIARLTRINWRTVGAIVARVVADELDPGRFTRARISDRAVRLLGLPRPIAALLVQLARCSTVTPPLGDTCTSSTKRALGPTPPSYWLMRSSSIWRASEV